MSQDLPKMTATEADQTVEFLTGLDEQDLTLDLSRQKLCGFFPATFGRALNQAQANTILHFFRDHHMLTLVKTTSSMRWFRTADIVDALIKIGPMSKLIDEWVNKSRAAVQNHCHCAPDEADRIRQDLEKQNVIKLISDYIGPGVETDTKWRWHKALPER